jgi:hypothetical protein
MEIYLYTPPEHPPPHVHVFAHGCEGVIEIETGELTRGKLKQRDLRHAQQVIAANRTTLLQGFRDAAAYMLPKRID